MHRNASLARPLLGAAVALAALPTGHAVWLSAAPADRADLLAGAVSIETISHVRTDAVGDSVWAPGSGSGFLVSREDCLIWTNHHVVRGAAVIEVHPRDGANRRGLPARVVRTAPRLDLAVIEVDDCSAMREVTLGRSAAVAAGDVVYAVGNPLGLNPDSVSRGIVSHTARQMPRGAVRYLQTDAAINPGNSGGPLFDERGTVIGINTAIASSRTGATGIGYAVPVDVARAELEAPASGRVSFGDAGLDGALATLTPDVAEIFALTGSAGAVLVRETPTEGPSAGRLRRHDVIYRIDGEPVTAMEQASRRIAAAAPGKEMRFDIVRDGVAASVFVTIEDGARPEDGVAADDPSPDYYEGLLGLGLEMWTDAASTPATFDTPVITRINSLGPAHRARIMSSQRTVSMRGPFMGYVQLDVKTVTGVVIDGEYHPITDVDTLESLAARGYAEHRPLVLEIQIWSRDNPRDPSARLELVDTVYHRVEPALTRGRIAEVTPETVPGLADVADLAFMPASADYREGRAGF